MSTARYSKLEDARVNGASSVNGSTLLGAVKVNGASSVTESNLSQNVRVEGASSVSESTLLRDVRVGGATRVNESTLSLQVEVDGAAHVNESMLQRAVVRRSKVYDSLVARSVLEDCNVEHCEIEGCTFTERELKYGVWRNGNLVGRTREDMEPVNREYNSNAGISITLGDGSQFFFGGGFSRISISNISVGESRSLISLSSTGQNTVPRISATRGNQRVSSEGRPANFLPPPKQTKRSEEYDTEIPEKYLDPLTLDIIGQAVRTPRGDNYDKKSITKWIQIGGNCPFTRNELKENDLRYNRSLQKKIDKWKKAHRLPESVVEKDAP